MSFQGTSGAKALTGTGGCFERRVRDRRPSADERPVRVAALECRGTFRGSAFRLWRVTAMSDASGIASRFDCRVSTWATERPSAAARRSSQIARARHLAGMLACVPNCLLAVGRKLGIRLLLQVFASQNHPRTSWRRSWIRVISIVLHLA